MKNFVINLSRCDTSERMLRSRSNPDKNKKNESLESKAMGENQKLPAKRNRRLLSAPLPTIDEYQSPPAKRKRQLINTQEKEGNVRTKRKQKAKSDLTTAHKENDEPLANIITMNCKLTNEVLSTKKQLAEKCDDLLTMQHNLHEKDIECMILQGKVTELEKQIKELEAMITNMRDQQFCDDLIKFEDTSEQSTGKFVRSLNAKIFNFKIV